MMKQNHPFHMVHMSPWPLLVGLTSMTMLLSTTVMMYNKTTTTLTASSLILLLCCFQWWRDVSRESSFQGFHTMLVVNGLRWGMALFICSEVLFFLSFFWAFFHSSLSPNMEMGMMWPPLGLQAINPFQVPLLNTTVLLSSGLTVTWSHHALINKKNLIMKQTMMATVMLGMYFTMLQGWEYWESSYSLSDSSFGSSFFLATGFHGMHVLVGTIFLFVSMMRHKMNIFSSSHHFSVEAAIWYWHFVDVVWLFLYCFIYWWAF